MARQGKFARLPHALREQVNLRLHDGKSSGEILAWLNQHPEAIRVWDAHFEGAPATPQNLSEWRLGGYKEWEGRRQETENLKTLSQFASELACAGGSLADGAAAIASGQILVALENAGNIMITGGSDDAEKDPLEGLAKIAGAVASLQKATTARGKLDLDRKRVDQKDRQLALDQAKFERQTIEKFMQFAQRPEAQAILNSSAKKTAKMEDLRKLMFG